MKRTPGTLLVSREVVASRPIALPIVRSTTFEFESAQESRGGEAGDETRFLYSRYENPTVVSVERTLAALEGAERAVLFGSGLAAVSTTALALLRAGDELVASSALYGGTLRFFRDHLTRLGVQVRFVRPEALADVASYGPTTRLCYIESPINPTLRLLDLDAIAAAAHARGVPTVVDATFATPLRLRPLEHGVDLVLHSATKYLNGHGDLLAGVVCGSGAPIAQLREARSYFGGVLDPQAAYELSRGLSTLEVRLARQCETALALAHALSDHPAVEAAHHPLLTSHPDHELAARLLPGGLGMLTLTLRGGLTAVEHCYDRLRLVRRAASLGSVESLASIPVRSSHTGFSAQELRDAGVVPGMLRLSIGLEAEADLRADLEQALGGDD